MPEATVVAIFTAPEKHVPLVSRDEVSAVAGRGLEGDRYFNAEGWDEPKREITLVELEAIEAANRDYDLGLTPEEIDRKSTRLNSSHSQISYAVFCLKKKKKKNKNTKNNQRTNHHTA